MFWRKIAKTLGKRLLLPAGLGPMSQGKVDPSLSLVRLPRHLDRVPEPSVESVLDTTKSLNKLSLDTSRVLIAPSRDTSQGFSQPTMGTMKGLLVPWRMEAHSPMLRG